ncbi:MAG: thioredoxin family protein [Saprospiraceae bacterium]|nr:thioredoxin family protein [Saprospiraceae bacterium]
MKQHLTTVLLATLLLPAQSALANVNFLNASLSEVRQMASREGKPYFVHFTASWCMPCQWMEKNTYADPTLARYANANYFSVKIDIDNEEGRRYKTQYSIIALPSILVFDERGVLLDRYEESLEAAALLDILQKHRTQGLAGIQAANTPATDLAVLDSPKPQFSLRRPALIPEERASFDTEYVADARPVPATLPAPTDTQTPRANLGYGVQVGVYSDYNNAVQQVARLEKKFDQPVNIFAGKTDGKATYSIVVGLFKSQSQAAEYLRYLNRNDMKGIVKHIAEM